MDSFKHLDLKLVTPLFDSHLTDTLMELNHLRKLRLGGSTKPWIFFQLKNIFHMLESVGSARIEGNRTTISEYVEKKIEKKEHSSDRFSEIANVELAMNYIENNISEGTEITHFFIRELHQLTVKDLIQEGDRTPGTYRSWNVSIAGSKHIPPEHYLVQQYMDELVNFINNNHSNKYDLIKTALTHHRFAWIHPFGNGNGRVVRLLTYALLIKYGFNVKEGKLLNPTAVFCNNRDIYYQKLSLADNGDESSLLSWCDYVLTGILEEIEKVNRLLDFEYLYNSILLPTLELGKDRAYLNDLELKILKIGIKNQKVKATDLKSILPNLSSRQITHQLTKMRNSNFIIPFNDNGRTYHINFMNNFLMRNLIQILEKEKFIPSIDS